MHDYASKHISVWETMLNEIARVRPDIYNNMIDWYSSAQGEITIKVEGGKKYAFDFRNIERPLLLPSFEDPMEEIDENIWRKNFAYQVNRRMMYIGVSQEWLSEKTGISRVTISKYLNCKSSPSGPNLERIARALGCSVGELIRQDL